MNILSKTIERWFCDLIIWIIIYIWHIIWMHDFFHSVLGEKHIYIKMVVLLSVFKYFLISSRLTQFSLLVEFLKTELWTLNEHTEWVLVNTELARWIAVSSLHGTNQHYTVKSMWVTGSMPFMEVVKWNSHG